MEQNRVIPRITTHHSIWEQITAISSLVLAVVGLAALIFTWKQIHEMRDEARVQIAEMRAETQVQHLTALMDKFDSVDRIAIRRSLALKRIDKRLGRLREMDVDDAPVELGQELDFCEDIGLLTGRGYLDRHDVWNVFGTWLFYLYTDARPYLDNLQGQADYRECKNLVESIRPIEAKEDASAYDHPTESDLYSSYLIDIENQSGQPASRGRAPRKP